MSQIEEIPHNRPTLDEREIVAATQVIRSGWVAQGPQVDAFESALCDFLGLPPGSAVAVSSGSAALYLALRALDLQGPVAIPGYACAALRNAVHLAGLTERLVDNRKDEPNIDLSAPGVGATSALILVHTFGIPSRFDPAQLPGFIIEDCAQAMGARVSGAAAGTSGDIGIYSFYATKMITTGGQGGAIVSRNTSWIEQIRDYRRFDARHDRSYRFNLCMTDLQAAIGRSQLARLPELLRIRREIFLEYESAFPAFLTPRESDIEPNHYRAVLRVKDASRVISHFARHGIRCIVPIEDLEIPGDEDALPNAFALSRSTVSVPLYPTLSRDDRIRINRCLREISEMEMLA